MAWSDDVFARPDSTDLHEHDACLSARMDALQPVLPADVTSGDGSDSLRRQDLDAARIGREELPELAVADRSMPVEEISRDRSRSPAAPRTATLQETQLSVSRRPGGAAARLGRPPPVHSRWFQPRGLES